MSDTAATIYTLSAPALLELNHGSRRFVHLKGVGVVSEVAPRLWSTFHADVMPVLNAKSILPTASTQSPMWAACNGDEEDPTKSVYRCGALLPMDLTSTDALTGAAGATVGPLGDGTYAKVVMTGWFDGLGQAWGDAFKAVRALGYTVRDDAACLENYLTDPSTTAQAENKTALYIPVTEEAKTLSFTLGAPQFHQLPDTSRRFLHQQGTGEFRGVGPTFWDAFWRPDGVFTTKVPSEWWQRPGTAGWVVMPLPGSEGEKPTFLGGVLVSEPLPEDDATKMTMAAAAPVQLGALAAAGGTYARFEVKGPFCALPRAVDKAVAATAAHGLSIDKSRPFLECYVTDPSETPDPENLSLLLLPIHDSQLTGPVEITLDHANDGLYLHLDQSGSSIGDLARPMWQSVYADLLPKLSKELIGEQPSLWACTRPHDDEHTVPTHTYRCGVLLKRLPVDGEVPAGAWKLGSVPHGTFARFVLRGWFDHLPGAYPQAMAMAASSGYTVLWENEACETYLTQPGITPDRENQTAIYLPIERKEAKLPTPSPKKARSESKK